MLYTHLLMVRIDPSTQHNIIVLHNILYMVKMEVSPALYGNEGVVCREEVALMTSSMLSLNHCLVPSPPFAPPPPPSFLIAELEAIV